MNEVFSFEGTNIRTVMVEDEPMFVGKDVSDVLGYKNGSRDINRHVDEDDKLKYRIGTAGQMREQLLINESGVYALIFGSELDSAKRFKKWVTSEVLPNIRKHGMYAKDEILDNPDLLIATATRLKEEKEKRLALEAENAIMQPKAVFADAVNVSNQTILVGDLAKLISQNGIQIGQNRLFRWMRENGYLHKQGSQYNRPTQRYMDQGLFKVKESSHANADGSVKLTFTTKVTGKGQQYFVNKFMNASELVEV